MGIQFKQIDNLQNTFDSLSGSLQGQVTALSGDTTDVASGDFVFAGNKYFTGNVDFSGAQGILVDPNNIYTPNNIFAGGIKIGGTIATPRTSTSAPAGSFQVTGGQSYFDDQINIRNNAGINIVNGSIGLKKRLEFVSMSRVPNPEYDVIMKKRIILAIDTDKQGKLTVNSKQMKKFFDEFNEEEMIQSVPSVFVPSVLLEIVIV